MNGYVSYDLAKMRIDEDHEWADNERLAREARKAHQEVQQVASSHEERPHFNFSLKRLVTRLAWT